MSVDPGFSIDQYFTGLGIGIFVMEFVFFGLTIAWWVILTYAKYHFFTIKPDEDDDPFAFENYPLIYPFVYPNRAVSLTVGFIFRLCGCIYFFAHEFVFYSTVQNEVFILTYKNLPRFCFLLTGIYYLFSLFTSLLFIIKNFFPAVFSEKYVLRPVHFFQKFVFTATFMSIASTVIFWFLDVPINQFPDSSTSPASIFSYNNFVSNGISFLVPIIELLLIYKFTFEFAFLCSPVAFFMVYKIIVTIWVKTKAIDVFPHGILFAYNRWKMSIILEIILIAVYVFIQLILIIFTHIRKQVILKYTHKEEDVESKLDEIEMKEMVIQKKESKGENLSSQSRRKGLHQRVQSIAVEIIEKEQHLPVSQSLQYLLDIDFKGIDAFPKLRTYVYLKRKFQKKSKRRAYLVMDDNAIWFFKSSSQEHCQTQIVLQQITKVERNGSHLILNTRFRNFWLIFEDVKEAGSWERGIVDLRLKETMYFRYVVNQTMGLMERCMKVEATKLKLMKYAAELKDDIARLKKENAELSKKTERKRRRQMSGSYRLSSSFKKFTKDSSLLRIDANILKEALKKREKSKSSK